MTHGGVIRFRKRVGPLAGTRRPMARKRLQACGIEFTDHEWPGQSRSTMLHELLQHSSEMQIYSV